MVALRFCGVTPASARMREASASLLMASAWNTRSTVTNAVAGLGRHLLGLVEHAGKRRRHMRLGGA